jgi:glycolate oxidase FAD binding subunit
MELKPTTIAEVEEAVAQSPHVMVRAGATKPALAMPANGSAVLDLAGLSGVLEYEPGEFTFTALAGTRVAVVRDLLAQHAQYLPFDPPLVQRGATLGGTVAAGLSGSGRYRFGGVRDFILGVRFVDAKGQIVRGGGKVVKNAAGFDLPKLMVGSLGQYGVLAEFSFKVFPRPEACLTVRARYAAFDDARLAMQRVYTAPVDVDALDLLPIAGGGSELWVRLGGLGSVLPARADRIRGLLGGDAQVLAGSDDEQAWELVREFRWVPPGWALVKVPLSPAGLPAFEAALSAGPALRRYTAGGNVAWVALPPDELPTIEATLAAQALAGLVVLGPPGRPLLGQRTGDGFARRVKAALDPDAKFATVTQ